ncbi:MAG: phosphoribosylanthranilate isomerase [Dehalococcoidia bacterium]|nr:phosphoribosylanthranilate isomerase [Dehalococcoidia bacterium]
MRVQIAGISTLEDALTAERAGADAIGFTLGLPDGPHNGLDESKTRSIVEALPPFVVPVVITYHTTAARLVPLCRQTGVSTVQLHGGAEMGEIATMRAVLPGLKVILAVHVTGEEALAAAREAAAVADAIILDSVDAASGRRGATGIVHDWAVSRRVVAESRVPVILAGGLTPENVGRAIGEVRPWGVDVHTGVERPDGTMDPVRVRSFVEASRRAWMELLPQHGR